MSVRHRDLFIWDLEPIRLTLLDPDRIRRSPSQANLLYFCRWYHRGPARRHIVVVVATPGRSLVPWVITAYPSRQPATGGTVWKRS